MGNIITQTLEDLEVQTREDGYINATQLCNQKGYHWGNYYKLKSKKEYISLLCIHTGLSPEEMIGVENKTVWIHPALLLNLAQWVSAEVAVMVSHTILEGADIEDVMGFFWESLNQHKRMMQ